MKWSTGVQFSGEAFCIVAWLMCNYLFNRVRHRRNSHKSHAYREIQNRMLSCYSPKSLLFSQAWGESNALFLYETQKMDILDSPLFPHTTTSFD